SRIIKKFHGVSEENNIDLSLNKNFDKDFATFDPDAIEQVFTNLIDNAIRHTKEDGYVHVNITSNEKEFAVSIQDNGSGIPEEDQHMIFERSYRADNDHTRNREKKGTDIGLDIDKNIIDEYG